MVREFSYKIIEQIAVISECSGGNYPIELNYISFNNAPPKYDLRKWDHKAEKMLKGITLTRREAEIVAAAILSHKPAEEGQKEENML